MKDYSSVRDSHDRLGAIQSPMTGLLCEKLVARLMLEAPVQALLVLQQEVRLQIDMGSLLSLFPWCYTVAAAAFGHHSSH